MNSQVDTGVDYYDVTTIDGVNLPMEMKPDPESSPLERDDECQSCLYFCCSMFTSVILFLRVSGDQRTIIEEQLLMERVNLQITL